MRPNFSLFPNLTIPREMNSTIFARIDPSYVGLLQTCLIWTLLASGDRKLRIQEVVDAYSRLFMVADITWERSRENIEFYKEMLPAASFRFFEIDPKNGEITLKKPAIVRDSFVREPSEQPSDCVEPPCKICQGKAAATGKFTFTERRGHLDIAKTICE